MADDVMDQINGKLDAIVRLMASRVIEGKKNNTEAILALGKVGLDRNLIANIVGTKPNIVSARLSEAKKTKKGEKMNE